MSSNVSRSPGTHASVPQQSTPASAPHASAHLQQPGAAMVDPHFELHEAIRLSRAGLISLQEYSAIARRATNVIVEEGKRKQALIDQYIGRTPTPAELQRDFGYTPEQLQAGVDYYMRMYNTPVENAVRSRDRPRNYRSARGH